MGRSKDVVLAAQAERPACDLFTWLHACQTPTRLLFESPYVDNFDETTPVHNHLYV